MPRYFYETIMPLKLTSSSYTILRTSDRSGVVSMISTQPASASHAGTSQAPLRPQSLDFTPPPVALTLPSSPLRSGTMVLEASSMCRCALTSRVSCPSSGNVPHRATRSYVCFDPSCLSVAMTNILQLLSKVSPFHFRH